MMDGVQLSGEGEFTISSYLYSTNKSKIMSYPVDDKKAKELRDYLAQLMAMDDETFRAFLNIGRMEGTGC